MGLDSMRLDTFEERYKHMGRLLLRRREPVVVQRAIGTPTIDFTVAKEEGSCNLLVYHMHCREMVIGRRIR